MSDQEKVIDELKEGIDFAYHRCHCGLAVTMEKALALLKPQEPVPVIITSNEPFGPGIWCDCGNCGETLIVLKCTNTEAASKMIRYCRKCGRAVKWG